MRYGTQLEASDYTPLRSVIGETEKTAAGNVVVPVGREIRPGGWTKTEHVVLVPDEVRAFVAELLGHVEPGEDDEPRDPRLVEFLESFGVDPDYDGTDDGDRYVAVLVAVIDGESNAAVSAPTLTSLARKLEGHFGNDNPRDPTVGLDLQTGERMRIVSKVEVTFDVLDA